MLTKSQEKAWKNQKFLTNQSIIMMLDKVAKIFPPLWSLPQTV